MLFLLSLFMLSTYALPQLSTNALDALPITSTDDKIPSTPCSPLNISCSPVDLGSIKRYIENKTTTMVSHHSTIINGAPINTTNLTFVDKLSKRIRVILKHFQAEEPIGLPGQDLLTEPMHAPDTNASVVMGTGYFSNITVWGLSNFSIHSIDTKLDEMQVFVILKLKKIIIKGDYSINNLFVSNSGPFNITLTNVTANGTVDLEIDDEGKLHANQSAVDMNYENIDIILTNVSEVLEPFVNTGGAAVLQVQKANILENMNERLVAEMNARLTGLPKIPSLIEISPVDLAVLEGRKFVKARYEPFVIPRVIDFQNPFAKATLGPVSILGLSNFARVGNVTLSLREKSIILGLRVITGRLFGSCHWAYDFDNLVGLSRKAHSNFTVEHVQIAAKVNQSIDSRKPPILEDLQIEMGPVYVKMDRNSNFDYIVELLAPMLPKMLRYIIIDALENPIKHMVQRDVLNHINIEQIL